MLTINIVNASRDDTFDVPPMNYSQLSWQKSNRIQYGPNVTDTPFGPYMYNETSGTKWCDGAVPTRIATELRWKVMDGCEGCVFEESSRQGVRGLLSSPARRKGLGRARKTSAQGWN
jgi:hypothetical protein